MQVKGKLQVKENKGKKTIMLILPTKKGESPHPIPDSAKCFNVADATDGIEVDVEKDPKNQIVKVTIPGKSEVSPAQNRSKNNNQRNNNHGNNHRVSNNNYGRTSQSVSTQAEPASYLKFHFHNPYTFIPFTKAGKRHKPTLQTADETEERFTGIIELKITTQSPLLSYQPKKDKTEEHAKYEALTIGEDVIVPAASIRGALRYLLTVITGGPLTRIDEDMFLCQGRDLQLGLADNDNLIGNQRPCVLARVVKPGDSKRGGTLQLGQTELVPERQIKDAYKRNLPRPEDRKEVEYLWADAKVTSVVDKRDDEHPWQIKLSGRPVNTRGVKKEGIFLANGKTIELDVLFWNAYANRNKHGARPALKSGDLVWLELDNQQNVVSIQWARWGKQGKKLTDILPKDLYPDYMSNDGNVSEVTDMFGIVPVNNKNSKVSIFAGRIRPDNLVFLDGKKKLTDIIPIAVLSSPHPGCIPFYRRQQEGNSASINQNSPLAGYKIYRTSKHAGINDKDAPWRFENQGTYDEQGRVMNGQQNCNFSAQLLEENSEGILRLSVHSLSWRELSLLILVCNNNTWRLGGGKPLGLGQCKCEITKIYDEFGNEFDKNDSRLNVLTADDNKRFNLWKAAQKEVDKLCYPRAAIKNANKITRGGLSWFQKLGTMNRDYKSMQSVFVEHKEIQGQVLPAFSEDLKDFLYGYDILLDDNDREEHGQQKSYKNKPQQFDPNNPQHVTGQERSEGFHGQNRDNRKNYKGNR
jgi:hypothetical protein